MEIIEVEIEKIRPDENQPRTFSDEESLKELAQSILTEGVINPIEIDKDFKIITGERRWRAAKIAGLKTIPAKILEIDVEERFMRQMNENLHNDTMSFSDIAKGFKKMIDEYFRPAKVSSKGQPQTGVTWLKEKTGKSLGYIEEHLEYLKMDQSLQKAVEEEKVDSTMVRVIQRTPEEHREKIQEKAMKGEFKTREGAMELVTAIKREGENPEVLKELLEKDYSKYEGSVEMSDAIAKISPRLTDILEKSQEPSVEIGKLSEQLGEWIKNNPRRGVGKFFESKIIVNMNFMKLMIDKWFKGDEEEQKLI